MKLVIGEKPSVARALSSVLGANVKEMKPMSEYDNLYSAGFCRAKADWLVGMNGSRLFSCRYHDRLNLGRVQTPTLAMIVHRDYDVEHFVKQKYFTADLDLGNFTVSSERIDDEQAVNALVSVCNGSTAAVTDIKREIKTVSSPKLYDLTTLQREANKTFGYTAQQTLDYIQSLYEGKLVTYPRTDSQYLTEDMQATALEITKVIGTVFDFGTVNALDISRCINNSKVTGHHAIIPTANISAADISALPDGERNLLTLIANRLFCASASPHRYEAVKVTASCGGTYFSANGKTVLDNGWKAYAIKNKEENTEKSLPAVSVGQTFTANARKGEHFTRL